MQYRTRTLVAPSFLGQIAAVILCAAVSITLAAAQGPQGDPTSRLAQSNAEATVQRKTSDFATIRIGPGDLLDLSVFDIPELAQVIRVSDQGDAVLTMLGTLHLAGMTAADAQTLIERRLREGNYILDPHVSVVVREYDTQGVSVLGEVRKPGVYLVLGARSLLDVVSEAGGLTEMATQQATIKRRTGDVVLQVNLSNEPSDLPTGNIEIQPGDTVVVARAGIVYVIGDVGRPGGFVMQNKGGMTLLQAVALAGGVNRTASQSKTRLIHRNDAGFHDRTLDVKRILEGKAVDVALNAEDIIYIPSSKAKQLLHRAPDVSSLAQSAAASAIYLGMVP
jgi:polysaccharide export outer membrane protein